MNDFTNIIKTITPPKTKLTIENKHLKTYCMMYLLLKMMIFHCHVSFLEGKTHNHEKRPHSGGWFQWNPLLFRENQLSTVFQFTFSPYASSAQEPCFLMESKNEKNIKIKTSSDLDIFSVNKLIAYVRSFLEDFFLEKIQKHPGAFNENLSNAPLFYTCWCPLHKKKQNNFRNLGWQLPWKIRVSQHFMIQMPIRRRDVGDTNGHPHGRPNERNHEGFGLWHWKQSNDPTVTGWMATLEGRWAEICKCAEGVDMSRWYMYDFLIFSRKKKYI